MARSGINKSDVQAARLALLSRGENPTIDAIRIEMGNTGSKTTIHRLLQELDTAEGAGTATPIDDELAKLVARLGERLRGKAQEHLDEAEARLAAEKQELQATLRGVEQRLADLIERHAGQTTKLGTQTATLLSTQNALQAEQKENARLSQAVQDNAARLQDKDGQIRLLKEQHLHAHTECALLQERLQNAQRESDKLQERLTERDQQNRVLELILIKTEVALENLRTGHPTTEGNPNN